ncbi:uncharacterized protein [Misgurnus anguillicaudatus]|uniref:uncharacterized protein n=1 Tax=Misgurnus anguillicaudatus TaxID=75329 RepID=UPI003CCFA376
MDSITLRTQRITTAEDMRNQTQLLSYSWEEYLTPAPLSIAILGELACISSTADFSINKNPPAGGYKHIRYPESFRACLMQVCNSGWWAFNEAHKNMDKISLHTARVPDYMKTAVKLLFCGNNEVIEAHLPNQLKSIGVIAEECLKLSIETEDYFRKVVNIIQELFEACLNSKTFYGKEMQEMKRKLEEAKIREQSAQETKRRMEKAMKDIDAEVKRARESYKKALDSLPTGWNLIGMEIVGGIFQSVNALVNGLAAFIAKPTRSVKQAVKGQLRPRGGSDVIVIDDIISCSKSAEILALVLAIEENMFAGGKENEIDWKNLYDQKENYTKTDFIEKQFKRINGDLKKVSDCQSKAQAQVLCQKAINICRQLARYAPEGKCDKATCMKIIKEVLDLKNSACVFDSKSKALTQSPAISPQPPMMFKKTTEQKNMNPAQRVSENARFLIEQNKAQLQKAMELREKSVQSQEENMKELDEILISMRKCELDEIDFETTIKMLTKGMDAIGQLQKRWQKMVQFFQMISNLVQINLNPDLKDFVLTCSNPKGLSYDPNSFAIDLLYKQAFKVSDIASLVNMISRTYTQVSNKYLMDNVGTLSILMAMDPESDPEFGEKRKRFQDSCEDAKNGISKFVKEKKKEYTGKSIERQKQIQQELLAILPKVPQEKAKKICENVQAGFSEEEAAEYI